MIKRFKSNSKGLFLNRENCYAELLPETKGFSYTVFRATGGQRIPVVTGWRAGISDEVLQEAEQHAYETLMRTRRAILDEEVRRD